MKDCKVACFSDLHLGHKSNDTLKILQCLRNEIFENKLLEEIDALFIAGDIFDRLLQLDYPGLPFIDQFFADLLRRCKKTNTILRLLEGTPSHDRGQTSRVVTIEELIHSRCDFKYINTLQYEYLDSLDCHVLYVPDEYKPDNAETLAEVKELLKDRGLKQFDIAIMHGAFGYQFPAHLKLPVHDINEYEAIVRTIIFIGHVHTHSRCGKVFAQGSFDRLRHGEEEPKGFGVAEICNNRANAVFIANKYARVYKTIQLYNKDLEEAIKYLKRALANQPIDACIRIEAEPGNPIFSNILELQKLYPTITFTKLPKLKEESEAEAIEVVNEFNDYKAIDINSSNLIELVVSKLDKQEHTSEDIEYISSQLKELL